jgi:hypothetical protein
VRHCPQKSIQDFAVISKKSRPSAEKHKRSGNAPLIEEGYCHAGNHRAWR